MAVKCRRIMHPGESKRFGGVKQNIQQKYITLDFGVLTNPKHLIRGSRCPAGEGSKARVRSVFLHFQGVSLSEVLKVDYSH
jgi:hypothetical protein